MANRQVMKWNAEIDQQILLAFFQHVTMTAGDWDNVMNELRSGGFTFSESALRSAAFFYLPGWDAVAHEALLLCILDEVKPNKAMLTQVTARMKDAGFTYSYDAINQHIQKLRRNRGTGNSGNGAPGTPSKATAAGGKKTPSKRNKKELSPMSNNDDDDDNVATMKREADADVEMPEEKKPVKKRVKRETKQKTPPIEVDDDSESGEW
ncbi:hypothetical protein CP533_1030 [Ophiocordyceps camponoti-saundersi (nom. inval.)]|nr:hypothetical protein CP533_1030 [Ophiocordyceps camponoti-saundersi (nom. inval.)]